MNRIFLVFFLLTEITFIKAQSTSLNWVKSFNGSTGCESHAICTDASGNVYTGGFFWDTYDFDPGVNTYTLYGGPGGNVFISKLDSMGNFIWAKKIGSAPYGGVRFGGIAIDSLNNVYVSGYFEETCDFDPGPGVFNISAAALGYMDVFIEKLDAGGNFIWAKSLAGSNVNHAYAISVDGSGNVYTCGQYKDTVDFDPGSAVYNMSSVGNYDCFISKLDAFGNFIWAKTFGGISEDGATALMLDNLGNIHVAGDFKDTVDFDPGPGILKFHTAGYGDRNMFLLKLSPAGNLIWAKNYGGQADEIAKCMKRDSHGYIYITGVFTGQTDLDPSPNIYNLSSAGTEDIYVLKLDSFGSIVWAKRMGGTLDDQGNGIAIDKFGYVYTVGRYLSTATDFDPGLSVYNLLGSSGAFSFFISKLDSLGNFVWAKGATSTNGNNCAASVSVDLRGRIYTTGWFTGTIDFDLDAGVFNLVSGGYGNIFVHKMDQCIAPLNTTNATNQIICSGNSATLTAVSFGSVDWFATSTSTNILSSGNNFLTPALSSGTYSYYVASSECINNVKTPITITVNSLPVISAFSTSSVLCFAETSTLTASGALSYTWYPGGSGNVITISPSANTTYSIMGTDGNGCINTAIFTQSVGCVGLKNYLISDMTFNFFPNPTMNILNIEVNENVLVNFKEVLFEITNLLGEAVLRQKITLLNSNVFLEHLNNGIYNVSFILDKAKYASAKIIKE